MCVSTRERYAVGEERGITADAALRLARLFRMSPQFWMRLQGDWDLHQAIARQARKGS